MKKKKKPQPPLPSSATLARDLHHVLYEIQMMWQTGLLMRNHRPRAVQNALVESFVIHCRCLTEFFSTKPKRDADGMRATDFIPKFKGLGKHPQVLRMHKEVGHLSYARKQRGEVRGWNFEETAGPLVLVSTDFLREALKDAALMAHDNNKAEVTKTIELISPPTVQTIPIHSQPYLASSSSPIIATGYYEGSPRLILDSIAYKGAVTFSSPSRTQQNPGSSPPG